jgi:hypothetical protein
MCSRKMTSYCFTSGTSRVTLVIKPAISHEWGKDREVFMTSVTYPWSCKYQVLYFRIFDGSSIETTTETCFKSIKRWTSPSTGK